MENLVIAPQTGDSVFLRRGHTLRIIDVSGKQVADTWAIDATDPTRWLSAGHTLVEVNRLFPTVGQNFYDQYSEPILRFDTDSSPGPHDMLFPACDPVIYERRGFTDHPSCQTNFFSVVEKLGLPMTTIPNPVNFFQNSSPSPDRTIDVYEAQSRPGDFVEITAERDVHIIVTACSVDTYITNGWDCTEIELSYR